MIQRLLLLVLLVGLVQGASADEPLEQQIARYIRALNSRQWQTARRATEKLVEIGAPALPAVLEVLRDGDERGRGAAIRVLGEMHPLAGRVTPVLVSALDDRHASVRRAAYLALARVGRPRKLVLSILLRTLSDPDGYRRHDALRALALLGPGAVSGTARIRALLRDEPFDSVRRQASRTLAEISGARVRRPKPTRKAPTPTLHSLLWDLARGSTPIRIAAGRVLRDRPWPKVLPEQTLKLLILRLEDSSARVQYDVSAGLVRIGARAVPELISALGVGPIPKRFRVARILGDIGQPVAGVVPALLAQLREASDEGFRQELVWVLGQFGSGGAQAIPALSELLAIGQWRIAGRAQRALSRIGPAAVPALARLLDATDPMLREQGAIGLGVIGRPAAGTAPRLVELLIDDNYEVRGSVARALVQIGAAAVPALSRALASKSAERRFRAIEVLAKMGIKGRGGTEALVPLLRDPLKKIRGAAANCLGRIGGQKAIEVLFGLLASPDEVVRWNAQSGLRPVGKTAVPVFARALKDPRKEVRRAAARNLASLGRSALPALALLTAALRDADHDVRRFAAMALGNIGPGASSALPMLNQLRKNRWRAQDEAERAIVGIGKPALAILVQLLDAPDVDTRTYALRALLSLSKHHEFYHAAIPRLGRLLADEQAKVRVLAARTLAVFGRAAEPALPALWKCLEDPQPSVREAARETVRAIGLPALPWMGRTLKSSSLELRRWAAERLRWGYRYDLVAVLDQLIAATGDADARVRVSVVGTLQRFGRVADRAAPGLIKLMREDPSPRVRAEAASTLGWMTTRVFAVVPPLISALSDKARGVRSAAEQALGRADARAVVALMALVGHENADLRRSVALVLRRIGDPALTALGPALRSDRITVRLHAIEILGYLEDSGDLPALSLRQHLADRDPAIRLRAARALRGLRSDARSAAPELIEALGDSDARVREAARWALVGPWQHAQHPLLLRALTRDRRVAVRAAAVTILGSCRQHPPAVVAGLIKALTDREKTVRSAAAKTVGKLERVGADHAAALIALLGNRETEVRQAAIHALKKIRHAPIQMIGPLLDGLGSQYQQIRSACAVALGKMDRLPARAIGPLVKSLGERATEGWASFALRKIGSPAAPQLLACVGDTNALRRRGVAYCLGQAGRSPAGIAGLIRLLQDPDPGVSSNAGGALSEIGRPAVPALRGALDADQPRARIVALVLLCEIGGTKLADVPGLIDLLASKDRKVRQAASQALTRLGSYALTALVRALAARKSAELRDAVASLLARRPFAGPVAVRALILALKDKRESVHRSIAWAVRVSGRRAVTSLIAALADPDPEIRRAVAVELGRYGQKSARAIPALIQSLDDASYRVREAATLALIKQAENATGQLIESLDERNLERKVRVRRALKEIGARTYNTWHRRRIKRALKR